MANILTEVGCAATRTRTALIRIGLPLRASIVLTAWWYTFGNTRPLAVQSATLDQKPERDFLRLWRIAPAFFIGSGVLR